MLAEDPHNSCVPGVPGVSGQDAAGQGPCFCCENGSTLLSARDKRGGIRGLRFQKVDGQGEENGARLTPLTPLCGREGAWSFQFFWFVFVIVCLFVFSPFSLS